MAIINQGLAEAANLAVRTLQYQVRQAATTSLSGTTATATASPTSSDSASSTSAADPTQTTAINGNNGNNNNSNNGGQSSPLLFFVALGFGVVFTNLWIIVGVKYCFRYNARNRQMRMTGEDGQPITLENMPQHPRRRRREKKLMTMDEVNEKFPMMKYKSWVASRAHEGLPTCGGVSLPPSRANSLRDADGIIPVSKERDSTEDRPVTSSTSIAKMTTLEPRPEPADNTPGTAPGTTTEGQATRNPTTADGVEPHGTMGPDSDQDEDDDDHIDAALPPEALAGAGAGDTCAICIDTLEDDDDVRGLTCGHAFHAVCLDPWLTSRRACCPLCKADYYTPKPRPVAENPDGTQVGPTVSIAQDPRTNRMNMPLRPAVAWIGLRGRGMPMRFGHGNANANDQAAQRNEASAGRQRGGFFSRSRAPQHSQPATASGTPEVQSAEARSAQILSNIRQYLPSFGQSRRSAAVQSRSAANTQVTPSHLEAGVRPS